MFALGPVPSERRGLVSCALALLALLLAVTAGWTPHPAVLRAIAAGAGLAAVALHVRSMHVTLRSGMRRSLGRSFVLVRIAWGGLVASLLTGLLVALGVPLDGAGTLFGVLLLGGWLLTFALGILQRIVPFLASMHAARGHGLPPTPSALTATLPLTLHFHAHLGALALLAAAVLLDGARMAAAAAALGLLGAIALAVFYATSLSRMARGAAAPG
jgi:hypothetical protein